ncbi:MAG: type II secretion system F family protein [Parcubacteria group bacterium]|nr:type II secretion system F family protein [Parcubacteria group bacterium]
MEEQTTTENAPLKTGAHKKIEQNSGTSTGAFEALEQKILNPQGINAKFDKWTDFARAVKEEEKIFFTQNLGVMLKSGLSASRALRTLTLQSSNPKFQRALAVITRSVEKGQPIATAMEAYTSIFPPIFVNMIRAGEKSGQLERVLKELTNQLKRSHELRAKVKGAMMYPVVVMVAMILIGAGMLVFVIPKLLGIFKEVNAELPLPTQILITVSTALNEHILIYGPAFVLSVGALIYATRKGPGQRIWHSMILRMPVISKIAVKINLAKIARTLGSLMATDMPVVDSLKLTGGVVSNIHYRLSLAAVAGEVEKGKTISSELGNFSKLYPPVAQQMIQVGEETGEIGNILIQLAEFYEEDVKQTMESLPTIIEPIMILILGGAVGGMAIAVIMPMFSLANAV